MDALDITALMSELGASNITIAEVQMDDNDFHVLDSPPDEISAPTYSSFEKQKVNLQTYLDALPYKCESVDDMQRKLEYIIGKLIACSETKSWSTLTSWDAILQCWLQMRYPMTTSTRAKLVRFYYELCLLPGVDIRVVRSWAGMLVRLLGKGIRRKLEPKDLELSWRPLWRALHKELFPKQRLGEIENRNLHNVLLSVADICHRYFPAKDIPDMLDTFLPLVTLDTTLIMAPVLASFLPPTHPHLYLPMLLKVWEVFNSFAMDDRFLELAGNLSEEHVAGKAGQFGEQGGAQWKDIGIWSEMEWHMLLSKGFESMYIPVGPSKHPIITSVQADTLSARSGPKIKKGISRVNALAKLFVYSMAIDGPVRDSASATPPSQDQQQSYLAGSRALDSLDRFITSTESFFHPSNAGPWTILLTNFVQRVTVEFADRWLEEEQPSCKTPATQRLTPSIRRAFVHTLRTPMLLAMFSKDPLSLSMTQGALRVMAQLEPSLIMPELLERAYDGLEIVNETHRTTAVLKTLAGICLPLVSEKKWRPGQKHLLPLLELCIPGIDLNDPSKTIYATSFIGSVIQYVKVGDISMHHSGFALSGDAPSEDLIEVGSEDAYIPEGVEVSPYTALGREEERALVRESTSAFADWVVSLFHRVIALYENLPEEGGRKKTTGGTTEDAVLRSIKSMMEIVCTHLSDQLFDLVLGLVFDYATSNAKANAVKAFGQLIGCLARSKPQRTIDKFLPTCFSQIQEELKHGAVSRRTTSTHDLVPSDTTYHWNIAILRGCLGHGGPALLRHKEAIIQLFGLLLDKAKCERGYSGTGVLLSRVLNSLTAVYPISNRFVNDDQWSDLGFNRAHNIHWGRLYDAKDVTIQWHVPNKEEIEFVMEVLARLASPALDKIESLLDTPGNWDSVACNDFCRYLVFSKAVWTGMPTIYKEAPKEVVNPCLDPEVDIEELLVHQFETNAGLVLTDPEDPRYQQVVGLRTRFGELLHRAATKLHHSKGKEDHIDAVIVVVKAISTYFLDYGMTRSDFTTIQKNFVQASEVNRMSSRQKENTRSVWVKRAQLYHAGRLYMHALYRRRSALDDSLLKEDLAELCLSSYTRVRRLAQNVLHNICGYFIRSTRFILPIMLRAITKGNNPDRMKGALYVLGHKGTVAYTMADSELRRQYLLALLECQHEEKPSIQKLVATYSGECLAHLNEEVSHTAAYSTDTPGVDFAVRELRSDLSPDVVDTRFLKSIRDFSRKRIQKGYETHEKTIQSVLEVALRPSVHWRYIQMAIRFILGLLIRDRPPSPEVVQFLMEQTMSVQSTIRTYAQQGIIATALFVKMRTYAKSDDELWFCEWKNPLVKQVAVHDPSAMLEALQKPLSGKNDYYVDKINTGFLSWSKTLKAYSKPGNPTSWERASRDSLDAIKKYFDKDYFSKLTSFWSEETNQSSGSQELRSENVLYVKTLTKMFEDNDFQDLLDVLEQLLTSTDKFQQLTAAEILAGITRGSKHWSQRKLDALWAWVTPRLDQVLAQAKPDTVTYWSSFLQVILEDRDPRRNQPLVDWILSLHLDFQGDSAFAVSKSLNVIVVLMDSIGVRFNPMSEKYVTLFFDNMDSDYAEIRSTIAGAFCIVSRNLWRPSYPSTSAFLDACNISDDPLRVSVRDDIFNSRLGQTVANLEEWKAQRLAPPRASHSQYDKVGLTLLMWLWESFYTTEACLAIPSAMVMLPEILKMSELNDSTELQNYSTAVVQVLSGVFLPASHVEAILETLVTAIQSSTSWRIRLHTLPAVVMFFYRNLLTISSTSVSHVLDVFLECLADENVEVREMSSKALSGIVRCSQRQNIVPLKNRFIALTRSVKLPPRSRPDYNECFRKLHSAILGLCALIKSFPYSVEHWMPPLVEALAEHATDPPPISTTIRECASEFKKTHQDTWHKDQLLFNEDQLQSLSTILVGTSYYA